MAAIQKSRVVPRGLVVVASAGTSVMSSSDDSSSEDEEEKRQRAAMASCVMSGEQVVQKADEEAAAVAARRNKKKKQPDAVDEDGGGDVAAGLRDGDAPPKTQDKFLVQHLDAMISRSIICVDDVWGAGEQATRKQSAASSSQLRFFSSGAAVLHGEGGLTMGRLITFQLYLLRSTLVWLLIDANGGGRPILSSAHLNVETARC